MKHAGDAVSIGVPSASGGSCDHLENAQDIIQQELRYLSLLSKVTRIGTYEGGLFMSAGTDIYLLFEAE